MNDNEAAVRNWHAHIVANCRSILGRDLTPAELKFITSRGGLIALEMIADTVNSLVGNPDGLASYLRSESHEDKN